MSNSSDYYLIDGHWTDSKEKFFGYIVCKYEYLIPNDNGITEEDVFYYGMSRDIAEINVGLDTFDFVIENIYDLGASYGK